MMKNRMSGKVPRHLLMTAALIATMGMASTGRAGTILFSADGAGAANAQAISSIVLGTGNSLSIGSVPLPSAQAGTILPLLYQSTIVSFKDANGDDLFFAGLGTAYQLTVVLRFNEVVTSNTGMPGQVTFVLTPNQTGAFEEIYYNNNPLTFAKSLSGTGFNSGQLIFQGTPSAALLNNGNFSFTNGGLTPPFPPLDQNGIDNYPTIKTLTGTGSALVGAFADLQNSNFFVNKVTQLTLNGDLKLPYNETNPSGLFDATRNATGLGTAGLPPTTIGAPSVGPLNGVSGPNFIFQTTGTGSFTPAVPEPGTIGTALIGVAGLAFGMVRSRRRNNRLVA